MVANDYVHRIGRTGRAGVEGDAISLVCVDEAPMLRDIERLLGSAIPLEVVPGFEPDRSIRAEPIRFRTGGGGGGGRPTRRPAGRAATAGQNRPRRFDRRGGRQANASVGIGNGSGRWTNLPGERTRR
jgi:ATP-dependent RNA helicase RhlE